MAKYKDKHGTTKIGDFLRNIGKSGILKIAIGVAGKATGIPFLNAVNNLIQSDSSLSKEQKEVASNMYKMDLDAIAKLDAEITERWKSDNEADSWLSKNIRPMGLIASWVLVFVSIISAIFGKVLSVEYITLISTTHVAINVAYYGGREVTKNIRKFRDTK